jgi:hypothetical protein
MDDKDLLNQIPENQDENSNPVPAEASSMTVNTEESPELKTGQPEAADGAPEAPEAIEQNTKEETQPAGEGSLPAAEFSEEELSASHKKENKVSRHDMERMRNEATNELAGDAEAKPLPDTPEAHPESPSGTINEEAVPVQDTAGVTDKSRARGKAGRKKKSQAQIDETVAGHGQDDEEGEHEEEFEATSAEEDFNTYAREQLVTLLENLVQEDDVQAIKTRVALIKMAFLRKSKEEKHRHLEESFKEEEGKETPVQEDDIAIRFNEVFLVYRKKRQVFLDEQEKNKLSNLEAKKLILAELKNLVDSEETLKKTYDEFKGLQEKWKQIGMVPSSEVNNLWQSYHFYVEKFFDKVKINKELRDLDLKKNLEAKIELCEKAEELLLETSILKSFKQLQKYHEQWKEIGPAPADKKDEIWERFKNVTDKINERRREHYVKLKEEQENNIISKNVLCDKAEELLTGVYSTIHEWQTGTTQMLELLKVWKTIGPGPRKQNDEVWERFKTSLDGFFSQKKEFFGKIKEQQINNYNLKVDLCVQAEALKDSTNWRKTTQDLINLQQEWKKIGPVPKKHSDKIWKRFRAACDEFFNRKSQFFSNIEAVESENLKLREDLIKKVKEYPRVEDKNLVLEDIKNFQRLWTEIGHVPMKDKDRLHNEFRTAINEKLDSLKISRAEMDTLDYRDRLEGMKDSPNARRMISSERNYLINRRNRIEEEIKLWENNIGFLAQSQKAQLLKDEFEKKINKAKDEIEMLNAKLKLLNDRQV